MKKPIHDSKVNRVLLKPRFHIKLDANEAEILEKFRKHLKSKDCKYSSKIVDNHVVIDVPAEEDHFWSPQMHVEIDKEGDKTIVKGVLGPKPKVWTFFMFLHFAVAITFFVFFVIWYSKWSLKQDYTSAMIMCLLMPVVWIILYFAGQLGKKFGYRQMVELHEFLMMTLGKND